MIEKKKRPIRIGEAVDTGATYAVLLLVAAIFFFPCLWLILASFSKSGSIYSFDGFFPHEYSLSSFEKLFTDTSLYNYPQWFLNTLIVTSAPARSNAFALSYSQLVPGNTGINTFGLATLCLHT